MSVPTTRRNGFRSMVPLCLAALMALALGLPATGAGAAPARAGASEIVYRGDAWGTIVTQKQGVRSGHSAPVALSCLTKAGTTYQNKLAHFHAPQDMFDTGALVNTAQSIASGGNQTAQATAVVHNLSMLQGTIQAETIKSVSATTRRNGAFSFSTDGSLFGHLVINGHDMGQPAQHQEIPLPGLGKVILFDTNHTVLNGKATQYVNAITVKVLRPNDQGIPVGTKIVVGHARSGLAVSGGPLGGRAWGSSVAVGHTLESGPSFTTYLPCPGTDGKVIQQSGLAEHVPHAIDLGKITNTAVGTVGKFNSQGETSSQIVNVNIGDGQITADLIKADAKVQRQGGTITFDTSGSHLGGLSIQGQGQSGSPDPNTVIEVPGLGKITLYEVTKDKHFVIVRMFHLQVLQDNPDIPLGTNVVLGYAKVSVH